MASLPSSLVTNQPDRSRRTPDLMALLSARKLDRTLTSVAPAQPREVAPFLQTPLSERLGGGVPRGQMSEIVGLASSGRTSLAWAALAAATARGEWVALVDTFDRFDPERAGDAGVELSHLLWVRGQALSKTAGAIDPAWVPGERAVRGPGTLLERTVDRAIKALNLIVQSGVCTFVVLDLIDVPATALARVPRSTWLRIQRVIEGSDTVVILLAAEPVARSAGGISIATGVGNREWGKDSRREREELCREREEHSREGEEHSRETGTGSSRKSSTPDSRKGIDLSRGGTFHSRQVSDPSRQCSPASRLDHTTVCWRGHHDRSRRLGGLVTSVRATSPRGFVGTVSLQAG